MRPEKAAWIPKNTASKRMRFDRLYDRYNSAVYSFAFHLTRSREEADDLFQETWLRVVQNLPAVLDMKKAKGWLFTITANIHKDSLRKKRVRKLFSAQKKWILKKNPDETERLDWGQAVSQAVAKLPEKHRLIFVLKEVAGFKHSEISEILGMPAGTVKSLMYRTVRRLRRDLAADVPGE